MARAASWQPINGNMGDICSHSWGIEIDPDAMMLTDEHGNPVARDSGKTAFAALDEDGHTFITLDFASLWRHTEEEDTLGWAARASAMIHR